MKLVLPMAGNGQRFFDEGYDLPKPLIAIKGKPMFKHVIDNIGLTEDIICVVEEIMLKILTLMITFGYTIQMQMFIL